MLKKIILSLSTMAGTVCAYMFYSMYWKWKFNSEGRAFDPNEGVVYESSSFIWGIAAGAFFLLSIVILYKLISGNTNKNS